jgi:hypothetical protein
MPAERAASRMVAPFGTVTERPSIVSVGMGSKKNLRPPAREGKNSARKSIDRAVWERIIRRTRR